MFRTAIAAAALGVPALFGALPAAAQKSACEQGLDRLFENIDLIASGSDKRINYHPDIDIFYDAFMAPDFDSSLPEMTPERARVWLAANPVNICRAEAMSRIFALDRAKAAEDRAKGREIVAAKDARMRLAGWRAAPTEGAQPASFPRTPGVTADDYPPAALRAEEQGSATYEIVVEADGRITDCEIVESSGSAALDAATCVVMRREEWIFPARNDEGMPVKSRAKGRLTWKIPE